MQKLSIKKCENNSYLYDDKEAELIKDEILKANVILDDNDLKYKNIVSEFSDTIIRNSGVEFKLKLSKSILGFFTINILVNGYRAKVLVDTGAETTVFSDRFLKNSQISWNREHKIEVKSFNNSSSQVYLASIEKLAIKEISLRNLPVIVLEDSNLKFAFFKLDGIIGWDVLSKFDFEINYKSRELVFNIDNDDNNVGVELINATFPSVLLMDYNNKLVVYGLDTGARKSWISDKIAEKYNLDVVSFKRKKYRGASGKEIVDVRIVKEHFIKFGNYFICFNGIKTGYTKFLKGTEFDGVIGTDVLLNSGIRFINSKNICSLI